jgi:hypothetical protein
MSLAALGVVLIHIASYGTAPQADEGADAHIWQLLMVGQVPILIFYAASSLPRVPRSALQVVAVQLGAAAATPVFLLKW